MATEYTPPAIIAEVNDAAIHSRMMEELPDDIDKTEGGFAYDFTRPAALEKAEMLIVVNEILQLFFPAWSYGVFLDLIARDCGMRRRSATAARGNLTVTGAPGTVLPAGFRFATPATAISANIEFEVTEETVLMEGDNTVPVACVETGPVGNVPANSVTLMSSPIGGILTITNEDAITGGTDEEDDDSLRQRIEERDKNSESSYVGNASDYIRWAKEVDGVGSVICVPEWAGAGTGTVKLIVMDSNGTPANATILANVYNHIAGTAEDDPNRLAPIGAILTVVTAEPVSITISATVILEDGYDIDEVTAAYTKAVGAYFEEAKADGYVRHTRIGSVLSETEGILDYSSLLLNSGTANVQITADDYPTIDTITLTEDE